MKTIIILSVIMLSFSCTKQFPWENFKQCIKSAPSVMNYPVQIESLGKSHHAIGNYQKKGLNKYEWNSYVYFGTRYSIEFEMDVILNNDHTKIIRTIGEPKFNLLIYKSIRKNKGGGIGASLKSDISFGKKEWEKMMKFKDDLNKMLTVLNVESSDEELPFFKEFSERARPAPNQQINLSKGGEAIPNK